MLRTSCVALLVLGFLRAGHVNAQSAGDETLTPPGTVGGEVDESTQEEARAAYERGSELLRSGRFREAVGAFELSRRLVPNVANTHGLAVAHYELGNDGQALALLEALLEEELGDHQGEVAAFREEIRRDRARIRVEVVGAPRAEVRVDGTFAGVTAAALLVPVDPGLHEVVATTEDGRAVREHVNAERRREVALRLSLPEPDAEQASSESNVEHEPRVTPEAPEEPRTSSRTRRRRWIIALSAVVVLGAGVTTAALLATGGPDPLRDPVTGLGQTLGRF